MGFRVQGLVFWMKSLWFRVPGSDCRVQDLGFRVYGLRFRVSGFGIMDTWRVECHEHGAGARLPCQKHIVVSHDGIIEWF